MHLILDNAPPMPWAVAGGGIAPSLPPLATGTGEG